MMRKPTILINEGNLATGIVERERDLIENGAIWHKIFVRNAVQYDRDFVLRVLMEAVDPFDFIPVRYLIEAGNVTFLIKNCSKAIYEMCKSNLSITNPKSVSFPFKVAILLHCGTNIQVDVQSSIMKVLQKRYVGKTRTLNLTAFHKDPDLIEFCPLSQPKLLYFVLHLSKGYEYRTLKLCNNDIQHIKSFEAISSMRSLLSVDFRKNKIKSFQELQVLHHWPIVEVFVEDNPVCDNCLEATYIKEIRRFCPKLQKLDGFLVPPQTNFSCTFRRNFLCEKNGFDLVEQFVEHYFSLYDSPARGSLESMYTKSSSFTVTATYLQGYQSFANAKLGPYINISHNINKCADVSKTVNSVHTGARTIATILTQLPNTEHDPHSFTVDLLYYLGKMAVVNVTGVFREAADSLLEVDRIVGFIRTFVLLSVGNNAGFTDEFVIVNEMFNVSNATASQEARAFKSGPCEAFKDSRFLHQQYVDVAPARSQNDETQFIDALMKIAGLNSKWANKCLEETNFDLHKALDLFVELYKVDKIPEAAFLSQDEITKLTTTSSTKVTPVSSASPTKSPSPVMSQPTVYMPTLITDERANPYSDDPFDTSRPYIGIERRTGANRWTNRDADRELEREKELEQERVREIEQERGRAVERVRAREKEWDLERRRERFKEKQSRYSPPQQPKSPKIQGIQPPRTSNTPAGIKPSVGITNQLGTNIPKGRSRSRDSSQIIETIDLDATEDYLKIDETAAKQVTGTANSAHPATDFNKTAPAPVPTPAPIENQQPTVSTGNPELDPTLSQPLKCYEISMSELTEYENKLSNIKGHPNLQQKEIQSIMDELFARYPRDVKVWLLSIGTHYKRQIPQKAREMKNRAIKAFSGAPQLGFQIKLAAAQMEMEYVTGPCFTLLDKKVGEQNFLQILHQAPNNINIIKMYVMCLIKRYPEDEQFAWNIFKSTATKLNLKVPGGPQDFFDNCKLDVIQVNSECRSRQKRETERHKRSKPEI